MAAERQEIRGLAEFGDKGINCGVSKGESVYWVEIRDGGENKPIFLSGAALLRFAEMARQVVSENE